MLPGNSRNKFCRLCFCTIIDTNFEAIQDVKEVLTIVMPGMDLEGESGEHVICKTCSSKLFAALRFKSTCLETEDVIFPYISSDEESVVDLKEIYLKEKGNILLSKNHKICRLCFQLIAYEFVSLYEVKVNIMVNYLSQVNINATKDPVLCGSCFQSLCVHGSFLLNCRENHEKYVQYCGTPETNHIKLEESDKNSNLNSEEFKINKTCYDGQWQNEQLYIKTEETIIKIEEGNEERDSFSSNISEGTNRNNKEKHSGHSGIIDESVHKHEIGEVQVNECKSKIQKSESPLDIQSSVSEHKKESKSDLMYKCNLCSFQTRYRWCLNDHLSIHKEPSEVQLYKCDMCNYESKQKRYLRQHQLKHKDLSQRDTYKCHECNYVTKCKNTLKAHLLVHKDPSQVQIYQCSVCKYNTKHEHCLKRHQLKHKESYKVQIYKCAMCDHTTKYKSTFKRHLLIHKDPSELQMYKCEVCDFETKHKRYLKRHGFTHQYSNPQKYKCHECGCEFKYKKFLTRHVLQHKSSSKIDLSENKCKKACTMVARQFDFIGGAKHLNLKILHF